MISTLCFVALLDDLTMLMPNYAHRSNLMFWYIRPATSLLFEFAIALATICFAGEFTDIVQVRLFRRELSAAAKEGESVETKMRHRHLLISETGGPRLPVALPLHYAIILIFLPALGLGKLFEIASYRRDLELPSPPFLQMQASPPKGEAIHIKIAARGEIILDGDVVAQGLDKELDQLTAKLREIRNRSGEHFISLEVDAATRYDRLIAFLNVTERLNLPIFLQY